MNYYWFFYLVASVVAMLSMAVWLAWEDYDMRYRNPWRRNTSKLGFNYRRGGIWWVLIGMWLPFINLFSMFCLLFGWIGYRQKMKAEKNAY